MRWDHSYLGRRLAHGVNELFARCSCGQEYDGRGAAALLDEHLETCPDQADYLPISDETEAWVVGHYDDRAMTLDEWKAQR